MTPQNESDVLQSVPLTLHPKLLVVDDEEDIRTQMKWALEQDYQVLLAEDRRSALEIQGREEPSVVTLDLGLPPRPAVRRKSRGESVSQPHRKS